MNESEAKNFIADEVNKLLWQRLVVIGSLFGIANIIGFFSLWNDISKQAHRVAEEKVKTEVADEIERQSKKFSEIKDEAQELRKEYVDLVKQQAVATAELSGLAAKSRELGLQIAALTPSNLDPAVQLVNSIKNLSTDEQKSILSDLEKKKAQIDVPLGTMLPYFGLDLPEAADWVWADGQTNWPVLNWVPAELRGKPVPDMSNGLLVSGPRESVPNGQVWRNGSVRVPALELDTAKNKLQVPSLKGVWPLAEFGWVFHAKDQDPGQGLHYARADFREVVFVRMLTSQAPSEVVNFIRETGIGVDNSFVTYHPNGSPIRTDNYTNVPLSLEKIAQANSTLKGTAFTRSDTIQLQTSDNNPPSLVCRWIIRIR